MNEKRNLATMMRNTTIFSKILAIIAKTVHLDKARLNKNLSSLSPSHFYNHGSKTFKMNQRKERKFSKRKRLKKARI